MGINSSADIKMSGTGSLYSFNSSKYVSDTETKASIFDFSKYKKSANSSAEKSLYCETEFVKADNIKDAQKHARKNLGIKTFNVDDIDVANWINEGLTNIKNISKGRAVLPEKVLYDNLGGNEKIAETTLRKNVLCINKDFMKSTDLWLDDRLKWLKSEGALKVHDNKYIQKQISFIGVNKDESNEVINEFLNVVNNKKEYSPIDKISVLYKMDNLISKAMASEMNPEFYIEKLSKEYKYSDKIKKMINTYSLLNENERIRLAKFMLKAADIYEKKHGSDGYKLKAGLKNDTKFSVLYHEIGHITHKNTVSLNKFIDYRTPSIKGKIPAPALNFILDKNKIHTASLVSEYAKTSPVEFVAETFAAMCENKKELPKEVIDLYKEYNGPMIFD